MVGGQGLSCASGAVVQLRMPIRFMKFYKSGLVSKSTLVSQIFNESSSFVYTFIGYNLRLGHTHLKNENISDRFMQISRLIRSIRRVFGVVSPFEDLLVNLSCL